MTIRHNVTRKTTTLTKAEYKEQVEANGLVGAYTIIDATDPVLPEQLVEKPALSNEDSKPKSAKKSDSKE